MGYTVEHLETSRAQGFQPLSVLRTVLAELLHLNGAPIKLLNCGCGTGFFTRQYAKLDGVSAVGLDKDETLLSAARTLAKQEQLSIEFVQGDITKIPYPEASFDAVTSDILLEIFSDKTIPVSELVRVCRGGGQVLCIEPNYLSAVHYDPRLTPEDNRLWIRWKQAGRAFGAGVELPDVMRRCGLQDIRIIPWLWGGLIEDPVTEDTASYLDEREAELQTGISLGIINEEEANIYRALFQRTAAARQKESAIVLSAINVYLVCGQKAAGKKS